MCVRRHALAQEEREKVMTLSLIGNRFTLCILCSAVEGKGELIPELTAIIKYAGMHFPSIAEWST